MTVTIGLFVRELYSLGVRPRLGKSCMMPMCDDVPMMRQGQARSHGGGEGGLSPPGKI